MAGLEFSMARRTPDAGRRRARGILAPCRLKPYGPIPMWADPMSTDLGEAVLERAVTAYAEALGDRLVAGYALGSLAHGGFSPLVSDVDLGLILQDPVRAKDRLTIRTVARS